jgi:ribosomal protein L9
MEVTLRKAAALSQSLIEASRALPLTKSVSVSIYTETSVADAVKEAQEKLLANSAKVTALVGASFEIRGAIGAQNAVNGVSARLTEKAALDATEKLITAAVGGKANPFDDTVDTDSSVAQAKLDALKERQKAVVESYHREEAITVSVLTSDVASGLQEQLSTIRRRKVAIADELLTLNMTKKVTLSEATVALLNEFKLI